MKKLIYSLAISAIIFGCTGKDGQDGAIGPKGDKGETGATGPKGSTGATGANGANGSQAYYYDFELDVTKALESYNFEDPIKPDEIVFLYLKKAELFYTPVPYSGYAYDINKGFFKVDMIFQYASYTLFVDNKTTLPTGTKYIFRAVVIKAIPGTRLNMERYKDYNNLKSDFGLED